MVRDTLQIEPPHITHGLPVHDERHRANDAVRRRHRDPARIVAVREQLAPERQQQLGARLIGRYAKQRAGRRAAAVEPEHQARIFRGAASGLQPEAVFAVPAEHPAAALSRRSASPGSTSRSHSRTARHPRSAGWPARHRVEAGRDLGIGADLHAGRHPAARGLDQRAVAQGFPRDPEQRLVVRHGPLWRQSGAIDKRVNRWGGAGLPPNSLVRCQRPRT